MSASVETELWEVVKLFVDFEDRYDADQTVSDDEVRAATERGRALIEGRGPGATG